MPELLDARIARLWAVRSLLALGRAREEIDALNVYPVPDGDTGTNLYLTVEAACAAVLALPPDADLRTVAEAFAHGALLGARGNSGIITAQIVRGWADVLAERGVMDVASTAEAMRRADTQAWAAVGEPVEGTILSLTRAVAQAAEDAAAAGLDLPAAVGAVVVAAREALDRTPDQLEALRRAGVVDAGGRGFLVVLEALEDVVRGGTPTREARSYRRPALPVADLSECSDLEEDGPAYEVMYLLDATADAVLTLRTRLAPLGDSLVVVGGGGLWHVHVHVDDPGAAVEAGVEAGRPHRIRVTHFAEQLAAASRRRAAPRAGAGLVACAAGPGLAELFASAGAVVVPAGPGQRPSTADLLDAVHRCAAEAVVLLPNDSDTLAVAEAAATAARESGLRVAVVPTRAQVQGLAAAAVHDPTRQVGDDIVRMSSAAASTRDGGVTVAAKDAFTMAGPCSVGDALGVVQGDFAVVGSDLATVAVEVVERLLAGGGELVTLVTGLDADPALVEAVTAHLHRTRRDVEVVVHAGGQPRYPLLVGVE
ncbi:DAK2 domain-containing protein [Kineosporia sp. A_224]|uniref:DAK2 domain-containing protein n=1 Tax=Kineosporia sp. A_224 TaxID=1962180 RepID=UPI000B4B77D8|nr:DAK2 domain-containing protein [Kineosporia sp. A_224]